MMSDYKGELLMSYPISAYYIDTTYGLHRAIRLKGDTWLRLLCNKRGDVCMRISFRHKSYPPMMMIPPVGILHKMIRIRNIVRPTTLRPDQFKKLHVNPDAIMALVEDRSDYDWLWNPEYKLPVREVYHKNNENRKK